MTPGLKHQDKAYMTQKSQNETEKSQDSEQTDKQTSEK